MRRVSSAAIAGAFSPDTNAPEPIYRQLYGKVREQILLGRFQPGQQMPSTRAFAADLRVSRNTVLNAFDQLKAEGYLEGTLGSGTYVARALPDEVTQAPKTVAPSVRIEKKPLSWSTFGTRIGSLDVNLVRAGMAVRPLQSGVPAVEEFPFDIWTRISNRLWKRRPGELLAYGPVAGHMPLRQAIASYLTVARAVRCEPEQVIIVSGAQQAMDLTARLLLHPGDAVWLEEPGFLGAHAVFQAASASLIPVPVDEDGLNVERAVANGPAARLVYTTPSHQFPLGTTMSLSRRLELLRWAAKSGAWILEDDYDSEFRYATRPLPALQSLDATGSVIYIGTFSKVLFPALRLGYLVAPSGLVDRLIVAKAITDHHCPMMEQATLAEFISEGHFNRHIRRMRALYLERLEALLEAVESEAKGLLEIRRPEAGMQVVARLPSGTDDRTVARAAAAAGITTVPLSSCYLNPSRASGLLLGYAAYDRRTIRQAIRKLSGVLKN